MKCDFCGKTISEDQEVLLGMDSKLYCSECFRVEIIVKYTTPDGYEIRGGGYENKTYKNISECKAMLAYRVKYLKETIEFYENVLENPKDGYEKYSVSYALGEHEFNMKKVQEILDKMEEKL